MAVPVAKVEFGLTQSGGDYVFQDITQYVREVSITRGITRIQDYFNAGEANIILDNRTGYFDPKFASSPFYGQVAPTGAVRVSSNGVVIYRGFIQTWSFSNDIYGDHTATMTIADPLSLMAQRDLNTQYFGPRYTGRRVNEVLDLVGWSSGTAWRSIDAGKEKMTYDNVQQGTDALTYFNSIGDTEFGRVYADRLGRINFRDSMNGTATSRTWTRKNYCLNPNFESSTTNWGNATRSSAIAAYKGTWSARATATTTNTINGAPSQYGISYSQTNSALYQANKGLYISMYFRAPSIAGTAYIDAQLRNSSTGVIATTLNTAIPVTAGTTWQRAGFPFYTDQTIDTLDMFVTTNATSTYVDAVLIENTAYLDAYFDGTYSDTSNALYSVTDAWDGTTNLSTSTETIVETTPTYSYSAGRLSDTAGGTAYSTFELVYGSENTYGSVVLTSTAGTTFDNAGDFTIYGSRTLNLTYLGDDLTAQQAKTTTYLNSYDQPEYRINTVGVQLEAYGSAAITPVLGLDIWDHLTVSYTPPWSSAVSLEQRILGIDHLITPAQHTMTFHLGQIVP